MSYKIKNIKGFWSGICFLLLGVAYISFIIINRNDMDISTAKSSVFAVFCVFIGIGQVYSSLNSKRAKEDEQNDDERERLVKLKAESSTYKITFNISLILTLLLAIAVGVTKNSGLAGILVGVAIMPTIMIISYICSYSIHNKHN